MKSGRFSCLGKGRAGTYRDRHHSRGSVLPRDPSLTARSDPLCPWDTSRGIPTRKIPLCPSSAAHPQTPRWVAAARPLFRAGSGLPNAAAIVSWENGTQEWAQCLGRGCGQGELLGVSIGNAFHWAGMCY